MWGGSGNCCSMVVVRSPLMLEAEMEMADSAARSHVVDRSSNDANRADRLSERRNRILEASQRFSSDPISRAFSLV